MSVFPQFGIINKDVIRTIANRIDNNVDTSELISWIRVSSAAKPVNAKSGGLILESNMANSTFDNNYGGQGKSGRVGIDFDKKAVYAEDDREHRPSPVIESLVIENGTEGLSRKAKFTIKCFTLKQAEVLSGYFLEPGFIVLVEFGWNTNESFTKRADLMSGNGACEIAKYNSYAYSVSKRVNSHGQYDGFMGYITAAGYSSGDAESYNIDVELTTLGEIPAYLQIHKNGVPNDISKSISTGLKFKVSTIESTSDDDATYGLSLFQRMFNKLPSEQQTQKIKKLSTGVDYNGTSWTNPANYLNMDSDRREDLMKDIEATRAEKKDGEVWKHAEGEELFTEESYIRLELAFAILNSYEQNVQPQKSSCGSVPTYNYTINTNDTVLRAHRHIFSTDASKLYVPNTKLPSFYLHESLTSTESIPVSRWNAKELTKHTIDGCLFRNDINKYAFPSPDPLTVPHLLEAYPQAATSFEWGYLRNLYINFDFFIETIKRTNMVAKDCYYELLNGISSAVNSYWMFEIVEVANNPITESVGTPTKVEEFQLSTWETTNKKPFNATDPIVEPTSSNKYSYELAVKDTSFVGNIDLTMKKTIPKFYSRGNRSPFLSADLNMDLPAIMRNQILGQRSSQFSTQSEGQTQSYSFFSDKMDPVMEILDSFRSNQNLSDTPSSTDVIASNNDIITQKATVSPLRIFEDGLKYKDFSQGIKLEKYAIVITWNDTSLLKSIEVFDGSDQSNRPPLKYVAMDKPLKNNPQILAIDFTFTIHGNSGIKVGDVFMIIDIPRPFKNGVFQVMNTSHEVSGNLWKTNVTAKMRNIDFE